MKMHDLTLKGLAERCYQQARDKGWHDDTNKPSFSDMIALMHSELSEALEEYRNGHQPNETYFTEDGKPEGIPIEFADVVIRMLHYCRLLDIDLEAAVLLKLDFNATRPHRHGGKKI